MDSDRWKLVRGVFDAAMELLPEERDEFVDEQCADDLELRSEVKDMLHAARRTQALGVEAQIGSLQGGDSLPTRVGERVGSYRLLRRIGRGGMGDVYLAERADGQYQQTVAVKLVRAGALGPDAVRRFKSERQILARLAHANIARLLDGGVSASGTPYLVMQAIEGEPITRYCDQHQLGIAARLELFKTVCGAVQFAHQNLVVHRDIKPSNILVTAAGEVKLLDFGIAKLLDAGDPDSGQDTVAELRVMTPDYAAPEQILGQPVTTATDVYALGVLLYELLVGAGPHSESSGSRREHEDAVLTGRVARPLNRLTDSEFRNRAQVVGIRPRELRRLLKSDLERIVLKALRSEPERRYGTAGGLGDDVQRYLDLKPVRARPDTLGYRLGRLVRRRRVEVAAAAAVGVLIFGFGWLTVAQSRVVAQERDFAQVERDRGEEVIQVLVDMFEASAPEGGDRLDTLRIADFLQASEEEVLTRLEDRPGLRVRLQHVLGNVYTVRGQQSKAVEILTNAADGQLALSGKPDSMYAAILVDLGSVDSKHHGPKAETRLRESLALQRSMFGEEHAHVARSLQSLASVLDDPAERRSMLDQSLAISLKLLDDGERREEDVWGVALGFNQLGVDYYRGGDVSAAADRLSRSLELLNEIRPADHNEVLAVKGNLASILNRNEQHQAAADLQRELLAHQEARASGPTLQQAISLGNLGTTLYYLGQR